MIIFLSSVMIIFGFLTICVVATSTFEEDKTFGRVMGAIEITIAVMIIVFKMFGVI